MIQFKKEYIWKERKTLGISLWIGKDMGLKIHTNGQIFKNTEGPQLGPIFKRVQFPYKYSRHWSYSTSVSESAPLLLHGDTDRFHCSKIIENENMYIKNPYMALSPCSKLCAEDLDSQALLHLLEASLWFFPPQINVSLSKLKPFSIIIANDIFS